MDIGEKLELNIIDTNEDGVGIAKHNGAVVFVRGGVKGDTVNAVIDGKAKNYMTASIVSLLSPSCYRCDPKCGCASECGGCTLSHVTYEYENEIKRGTVSSALRRAGIDGSITESTVFLPAREGYRNKMTLHYSAEKCAFGYYAEKTHDVVCPEKCVLCPEIFSRIMHFSNSHITLLTASKPKELIIRSNSLGKITVTLKCALPHLASGFAAALREEFSEIGDTVVLDDRGRGKSGVIKERYGELEMNFSSEVFRQINTPVFEKMLEIIVSLAGEDYFESCADMYCGSGIIGLTLAERYPAAQFYGIEINENAVADARENARLNGIENIEFFSGDAAEFAEKLSHLGTAHSHIDLICADPPRSGLSPKTKRELAAFTPLNMIMISCNPQTLARDLAEFIKSGYAIKRIIPVNMFPGTRHVETVVLLSRETNPLTVEVRMKVETGEIKEHPTYKRIQEYVQEKYGFKVHTAYIAEVKRMVGLDIHKAPNAVEQRKHEYHPCPPEKVEAIKDALRHFGLIAE